MSSLAFLGKPGENLNNRLIIPGSSSDTDCFLQGPSALGVHGAFAQTYQLQSDSFPRISNSLFRSHMQPLMQAGPEVERTIVESIEEFGSDTMLAIANIGSALQAGVEAGFKTTMGFVGGHVGGAAGVVGKNVSEILVKLNDVNFELHQYANTHNHMKHAAKARVLAAYEAMQSQFNLIADNTISQYRGGRESALRSMKRGLEVADRYKTRALPLNTLPEVKALTNILKGAKYVSQVGLVLDLGIRVSNIHNARFDHGGSSEKAIKTAYKEIFGFGSALLATPLILFGGSLVFCTVLGPFGIVPAIVLAGTVGIYADKFGQWAGGYIADFFHK